MLGLIPRAYDSVGLECSAQVFARLSSSKLMMVMLLVWGYTSKIIEKKISPLACYSFCTIYMYKHIFCVYDIEIYKTSFFILYSVPVLLSFFFFSLLFFWIASVFLIVFSNFTTDGQAIDLAIFIQTFNWMFLLIINLIAF